MRRRRQPTRGGIRKWKRRGNKKKQIRPIGRARTVAVLGHKLDSMQSQTGAVFQSDYTGRYVVQYNNFANSTNLSDFDLLEIYNRSMRTAVHWRPISVQVYVRPTSMVRTFYNLDDGGAVTGGPLGNPVEVPYFRIRSASLHANNVSSDIATTDYGVFNRLLCIKTHPRYKWTNLYAFKVPRHRRVGVYFKAAAFPKTKALMQTFLGSVSLADFTKKYGMVDVDDGQRLICIDGHNPGVQGTDKEGNILKRVSSVCTVGMEIKTILKFEFFGLNSDSRDATFEHVNEIEKKLCVVCEDDCVHVEAME